MLMGQEQPALPRCPRCGGAMYKPMGSPFYWHSNSNHLPCTITSITDIFTVLPASDEAPRKSSIEQQKQKKAGE